MGGSESKNKVEIVNDITQQVIMDTVQSCQQSVNQTQEIIVRNTENALISDVTMDQYASFDITCLSEKLSSVDFGNRLQQAIEQMATAEAPAISTSKTDSENISKTTNKVFQEVKDVVKQECYSSIIQMQSLVVENSKNVVIDKISFNQVGQMVVSCLQQNEGYVKAVNDIATIVDQHAEAKTSLLGPLDIFPAFDIPFIGEISSLFPIISISSVCCICIIVVLIIATLFL